MKVYVVEGFYMNSDASWIEKIFMRQSEAEAECDRLTDEDGIDGDRLYCVLEFEAVE